MRLRSVSILLFLLVACLAVAQGCSVYYGVGKFTGLISTPRFSTRPSIPEDFQLAVNVHDVADPATDYELTFDRAGKATYTVTVRAPQRRQLTGSFEISEGQIATLWKTVADAKFDELDTRYPSSGDGKDNKNGVQTYYVFADHTEHRVESHFSANAQLEKIRMAVVSAVPLEVMAATGAPGQMPKTPKEFIGDVTTHLIHLPSCVKLKDVPPANRQTFPDVYESFNFGYSPCPDCKPQSTQSQ